MLEAIENDVVPRLLNDVPNQPAKEQLDADPYRSRFLLIFDREGYSPAFFRRMWEKHRIACITYHKFPKEDWPTSEYSEVTGMMPNGETVTMMLEDLAEGWILNPARPGINECAAWIAGCQSEYFSFDDWRKLDAYEVNRGKQAGRPRVKLTSVAEMLAVRNGN